MTDPSQARLFGDRPQQADQENPMKALTLWPEWCPAFSHLGKRLENRPKPPPRSLWPERPSPTTRSGRGKAGPWVAMHAGKTIGGGGNVDEALWAVAETAATVGWRVRVDGQPGYRLWRGDEVYDLRAETITRSAIVGAFRVTRLDPPGMTGPWKFVESWGICLEYHHLADPIPNVRGAQGWWNLPGDVEDRVRAQLPWP